MTVGKKKPSQHVRKSKWEVSFSNDRGGIWNSAGNTRRHGLIVQCDGATKMKCHCTDVTRE